MKRCGLTREQVNQMILHGVQERDGMERGAEPFCKLDRILQMRSIRMAGGETIEEGDDSDVRGYLGWKQQKTESAVLRRIREEQQEEGTRRAGANSGGEKRWRTGPRPGAVRARGPPRHHCGKWSWKREQK